MSFVAEHQPMQPSGVSFAQPDPELLHQCVRGAIRGIELIQECKITSVIRFVLGYPRFRRCCSNFVFSSQVSSFPRIGWSGDF